MTSKRVIDLNIIDSLKDTDVYHIIKPADNKRASLSLLKVNLQGDAVSILDQTETKKEVVELLYNNFEKHYLGGKETNPVKDNQGNNLLQGTLFYHSVEKKFKTFNNGVWDEIAATVFISFDKFNGDGSTTQFTMKKAASREESVVVFVDGQLLQSTEYSVSGTTLTLNSAPISGSSNVIVRNVVGFSNILESFNVYYNNNVSGISQNNLNDALDNIKSRVGAYQLLMASGTSTGDIVYWLKDYAIPNKFLLCDGSAVSKVTYSELYAIIGDAFNEPTIPSRPWKEQSLLNDTLFTTGTWTSSNLSPPNGGIYFNNTQNYAVYNDKLYTFGQQTSAGAIVSNIKSMAIMGDGTLSGTWVNEGNMPTPLAHSSVVMNDRGIYIVGGSLNSDRTGSTNRVYFLPDGVIENIITCTDMPAVRHYVQSFMFGDKLFVFGGETSSGDSTNTCWSIDVLSNGTLGLNWNVLQPLPVEVSHSAMIFRIGFNFYLVTTINSEVHTCPISVDGVLGDWSVYSSHTITNQHTQGYFITKNSILVSTQNGTNVIPIINNLPDFQNMTLFSSTNGGYNYFATKNHIYGLNSNLVTDFVGGLNDYLNYDYLGLASSTFRLPTAQGVDNQTVSIIKY